MKPLSFVSLVLFTLLCIPLEDAMFMYGKGQDRHPFLVCFSCPYSTATQSRYFTVYIIIPYLSPSQKLLRGRGSELEWEGAQRTMGRGKV